MAQKRLHCVPLDISSASCSPKPHQLPSGLLCCPLDFLTLFFFYKTSGITLWKLLSSSVLKNLLCSTLPKGIWSRTIPSLKYVGGNLCSSSQPSPHSTSLHHTQGWNDFFILYFPSPVSQPLWIFSAKFMHMSCSHFNLNIWIFTLHSEVSLTNYILPWTIT